MNRLPQFMARLDGADINYVDHNGAGPDPLPLILIHGMEIGHVIPLPIDLAAHWGDPADAFDVMVPSLPGYGFLSAPMTEGMSELLIREFSTAC